MMPYAQSWRCDCHPYDSRHHFRHDFTKDVTRPHTSQVSERQGSQSHGQHFHVMEATRAFIKIAQNHYLGDSSSMETTN